MAYQTNPRPTLLKRPGTAALAAVVASIASVAIGFLGASPAMAHGCVRGLDRLTARGCQRVFSDDGTNTRPGRVWGSVDCQRSSRVHERRHGGDRHVTAAGRRLANRGYRRITVFDGDDFWGERCELGRNGDHHAPNVLYHAGQHRITFMSLRLTSSFPLGVNTWQVVMQMKQTQPAANGDGTPVLSLNAFNGRWRLMQSTSPGPSYNTRELWSAPARKGAWTRFAFDVHYSRHADRGSIKVFADLNRDGDATDRGEQSRRFHTYTLKREIRGGSRDGIPAGHAIPSHLRAGIYHNPAIPCPAGGCAVDLDNVQVVKPG
jgi:hypothetical protein